MNIILDLRAVIIKNSRIITLLGILLKLAEGDYSIVCGILNLLGSFTINNPSRKSMMDRRMIFMKIFRFGTIFLAKLSKEIAIDVPMININLKTT